MVTGALDLLLSAEAGNTAFAIDDSLPPRTALLEAVFVLECVAPPALGVERFMPPLPLRVVVDTRLSERSAFVLGPRAVQRADDRPVDLARYRKLLVRLVPPMLEAATGFVTGQAQNTIAEAQSRARADLGAEIERLEALARVNPGVSAQEVAAARRELSDLDLVLPTTRARLDALRFIASPDFLALRA
jgi:ATP-dependent helicase HepA